MDRNEFRENLKMRDAETLEDRVKRRDELRHIEYQGKLPSLLTSYSALANEMYISGYFVGVILLCAAIAELILADKLLAKVPMTQDELGHFSLYEKTVLCHGLGILNNQGQDKANMDELRKLRNWLSHANAGNLYKMAEGSYRRLDDAVRTEDVVTTLYLANLDGKLKNQALQHLGFIRGLIQRWYGVEPSGSSFG